MKIDLKKKKKKTENVVENKENLVKLTLDDFLSDVKAVETQIFVPETPSKYKIFNIRSIRKTPMCEYSPDFLAGTPLSHKSNQSRDLKYQNFSPLASTNSKKNGCIFATPLKRSDPFSFDSPLNTPRKSLFR